MKKVKNHFFPSKENNYHAPVLHRKRRVVYTISIIGVKLFFIGFIFLLPIEIFSTPEVIQKQTEDIVQQTNILRKQVGLSELIIEPLLVTSATNKALDMKEKQYFAHISPEGKQVGDFFTEAEYDYAVAGENLAIGYGSAVDVLAAWKQSSAHYANLVQPVFTDIGVGVSVQYRENRPVPYFVQHFGVRSSLDLIQKNQEKEIYVLPQSTVFWKETSFGIEIIPQVYTSKPVKDIIITQFDQDIVLENNNGVYTTSAILSSDVSTLFDPILPVSVQIYTEDEEIIETMIPWNNPPILKPSVLELYHMGVRYIQQLVPLIIVSNIIMLSYIGILIVGLFGHILWSIHEKKQYIAIEIIVSIGILLVLFFI